MFLSCINFLYTVEFYLGYPNKDKHRVCRANVSPANFAVVDKQMTRLLKLLFKTGLLSHVMSIAILQMRKGKSLMNKGHTL